MLPKTFETMVKPILLYSNELWGYQMRDDNMIESTLICQILQTYTGCT